MSGGEGSSAECVERGSFWDRWGDDNMRRPRRLKGVKGVCLDERVKSRIKHIVLTHFICYTQFCLINYYPTKQWLVIILNVIQVKNKDI